MTLQGVLFSVYRPPKKHISKSKDRDIPYTPPYNEAQQGRDIPIRCLCLCAFWVPKFRLSGRWGLWSSGMRLCGFQVQAGCPETPISLNLGIFLKSYSGSHYHLRYIYILFGILLSFKVYSLIKGYWSLWVLKYTGVRSRDLTRGGTTSKGIRLAIPAKAYCRGLTLPYITGDSRYGASDFSRVGPRGLRWTYQL